MMTVKKIKQFFSQLRCVGLKVPRESDINSDLETSYPGDLEASSDFEHLQARRKWSRIRVLSGTEESNYYGGTALMLLISQRKSDLQICGLPCCHDTLSPSEKEKPIPIVPTFLSESYKMADRKASSSRPEKTKEAPGNAVSRFIRRLSPTKRYHGGETPGASSSSTSQKTDSRSGKKDSSATKNSSRKEDKHPEKLTKSFLNLPESSSSSSKSSNSQTASPWLTPAPSYQSLNQNEQTTELKLLSQLHANFDEATNILGNYISLRNQKK